MNFESAASLCNCVGSGTLREKLRNMLGSKANDNNLKRLRAILINSNALSKTHTAI
jgi:hypothetical protein